MKHSKLLNFNEPTHINPLSQRTNTWTHLMSSPSTSQSTLTPIMSGV